MRVLLDTNVLVRAAKPTDNPARELLRILRMDPHVLLVSPFLLEEVERVLRYPRVQQQHGLDEEEIQAFVADLGSIAAVVELVDKADDLPSADPDDNPILHAAVCGRAEKLCTRDRHFRTAGVLEFCQMHQIEVVTDLELLGHLRAEN